MVAGYQIAFSFPIQVYKIKDEFLLPVDWLIEGNIS